MGRTNNFVSIYAANESRHSSIGISMCLEAYKAMGSPKMLVFSETDFSLHTATLNTNKAYTAYVNNTRVILTVLLHYTPVDSLIGMWEWEADDLSLFLTVKQA